MATTSTTTGRDTATTSSSSSSVATQYFIPEHVKMRKVVLPSRDNQEVECPNSDVNGFLLVTSVEEKLSKEWAGMIRASKNFAAKEKYRFFDSSKYKPLIRKGLPFSRRAEMWKRLSDPGAEMLSIVTYENVWGRTFRWESLKESTAASGSIVSGGVSSTCSPPDFTPLFPPCFGVATYTIFQRIPALFSLTEKAVLNLRYLLCMIAESNPEIKIAPLLPALIAAMLTQLSPAEAFKAVNGIVYLSKDTHLVETRVQYLRLSTTTYDATIKSAIHFIQGKAPDVVKVINDAIGMQGLQQIMNHMFQEFFATVLPMSISLRVVDIFLNEGEKILYRVALSLFTTILADDIKRLEPTKEAFDQFFASHKVTDPVKINKIFVQAFYYSFSRETSKGVEAKYTNAEEILTHLYPSTGNICELRSRPELDPKDGGGILNTPSRWEHVFGFLNSPKLKDAAFLPARVERIYTTSEHGWNLKTMYRQCADALKYFPKEGHGVRGLLLVKGKRSIRDEAAVGGKEENTSDEIVIGACLHPLPDGQSFSSGGGTFGGSNNNRYTGSAGTFVFSILPEIRSEGDNAVNREVVAGANKNFSGALEVKNNSVHYSKAGFHHSVYYHYVGEPSTGGGDVGAESPRSRSRRVTFSGDRDSAKVPTKIVSTTTESHEEETSNVADGDRGTITTTVCGSTSASPEASPKGASEKKRTSFNLPNEEDSESTAKKVTTQHVDPHSNVSRDDEVTPSAANPSAADSGEFGELTRIQSMRREDLDSPSPESEGEALEVVVKDGAVAVSNKSPDPTTSTSDVIEEVAPPSPAEELYSPVDTPQSAIPAGISGSSSTNNGTSATSTMYSADKVRSQAERLTAFYAKYNPRRTQQDVDEHIEKHKKLKEGFDLMWKALEEKYGPEHGDKPDPTAVLWESDPASVKGVLKRDSSLAAMTNNQSGSSRTPPPPLTFIETPEKPVNRYFWMMEPEHFTIGGGSNGGPALRLPEDLHQLDSMHCQTFDSPCLMQYPQEEGSLSDGSDGVSKKEHCLKVSGVELFAIME